MQLMNFQMLVSIATCEIALASFYRPPSESSEGRVFTGVCHSVTERGGGVTPNASWDRSHGQGDGGPVLVVW